jgi:hypothetical protein
MKTAFDLALQTWRQTTSYLLTTLRSNRDPLPLDPASVQTAISHLLQTYLIPMLSPYIRPGAERSQADTLRGLMLEGAKFGLLLFQQKASYIVDFEVSGELRRRGQRVIVTFPGLIKVVGEDGRRYRSEEAKVVVAPEVQAL